jgi:hypothetical protein
MVQTFVLLVVAGGAGGLFGSIIGATAGKHAILAGGCAGGLIMSPAAAWLAGRFRWISTDDVKGTAIGAALGFVGAAAIAVNTLHSPVGPMLSPLLIGIGGLAGGPLRTRFR